MILVGEVLRSLPDAEDWYRTRGLGYNFVIDVSRSIECPTVSKNTKVFDAISLSVVEFRVVRLVIDGNYVYDWEMLA